MPDNKQPPPEEPIWARLQRQAMDAFASAGAATILSAVAATALIAAACGAPPPEVTASLSSTSVEEGEAVTLTLTASAEAPSDALFNLSATEGVTFGSARDAEATLTLAEGSTSADIRVNAPRSISSRTLRAAISVTAEDGAEVMLEATTLNLTISRPSPPEVTAALSAASVDEGTSVTLTISASRALESDATFSIAVAAPMDADADFDPALIGITFGEGEEALAEATLTIEAGQSRASIAVNAPLIADHSIESLESAISVTNAETAEEIIFSDAALPLTVQNLPPPELTATLSPAEIEEGGSATLTITASAPLPQDLAVNLRLSQGAELQDGGRRTATLTIPAGQRSITVGILGNEISSPSADDAEVSVRLTLGMGAPATIREGSGDLTLSVVNRIEFTLEVVGGEMVEPGAEIMLVINASRPLPGDVEVVLAATPGLLEEDELRVSIAAGERSGTISVMASEDLEEGSPMAISISSLEGSPPRFRRVDASEIEITAVLPSPSPPSAPPSAPEPMRMASSGPSPSGPNIALSVAERMVGEGGTVDLTLRLTRALTEAQTVVLRDSEGLFHQLLTIPADSSTVTFTGITPAFVDEDTPTRLRLEGLQGTTAGNASITITEEDSTKAATVIAVELAESADDEGEHAVILFTPETALSSPVVITVNDTQGLAALDQNSVTIAAAIGQSSVDVPLPYLTEDVETAFYFTGITPECCAIQGELEFTARNSNIRVTPSFPHLQRMSGRHEVPEGSTTQVTLTLDRGLINPAELTLRDSAGVFTNPDDRSMPITATLGSGMTEITFNIRSPFHQAEVDTTLMLDGLPPNCCDFTPPELRVLNDKDQIAIMATLAESEIPEVTPQGSTELMLTLQATEMLPMDVPVTIFHALVSVDGTGGHRAAALPAEMTGMISADPMAAASTFTIPWEDTNGDPIPAYGNQNLELRFDLGEQGNECCIVPPVPYTVTDTGVITLELPDGPIYEGDRVVVTAVLPETATFTNIDTQREVRDSRAWFVSPFWPRIFAHAPDGIAPGASWQAQRVTANLEIPFLEADSSTTLTVQTGVFPPCDNSPTTQLPVTGFPAERECPTDGDTVINAINEDIEITLTAVTRNPLEGDTVTFNIQTSRPRRGANLGLPLADSRNLFDSIERHLRTAQVPPGQTSASISFAAPFVGSNLSTNVLPAPFGENCCTWTPIPLSIRNRNVNVSLEFINDDGSVASDPAVDEGRLQRVRVTLNRVLAAPLEFTVTDTLDFLETATISVPGGLTSHIATLNVKFGVLESGMMDTTLVVSGLPDNCCSVATPLPTLTVNNVNATLSLDFAGANTLTDGDTVALENQMLTGAFIRADNPLDQDVEVTISASGSNADRFRMAQPNQMNPTFTLMAGETQVAAQFMLPDGITTVEEAFVLEATAGCCASEPFTLMVISTEAVVQSVTLVATPMATAPLTEIDEFNNVNLRVTTDGPFVGVGEITLTLGDEGPDLLTDTGGNPVSTLRLDPGLSPRSEFRFPLRVGIRDRGLHNPDIRITATGAVVPNNPIKALASNSVNINVEVNNGVIPDVQVLETGGVAFNQANFDPGSRTPRYGAFRLDAAMDACFGGDSAFQIAVRVLDEVGRVRTNIDGAGLDFEYFECEDDLAAGTYILELTPSASHGNPVIFTAANIDVNAMDLPTATKRDVFNYNYTDANNDQQPDFNTVLNGTLTAGRSSIHVLNLSEETQLCFQSAGRSGNNPDLEFQIRHFKLPSGPGANRQHLLRLDTGANEHNNYRGSNDFFFCGHISGNTRGNEPGITILEVTGATPTAAGNYQIYVTRVLEPQNNVNYAIEANHSRLFRWNVTGSVNASIATLGPSEFGGQSRNNQRRENLNGRLYDEDGNLVTIPGVITNGMLNKNSESISHTFNNSTLPTGEYLLEVFLNGNGRDPGKSTFRLSEFSNDGP